MSAHQNHYTKNDIASVIRKGEAFHTPVAEKLIRTVREQTGVDIVACYVTMTENHIFQDGRPTYNFVDRASVSIHVRSQSMAIIQENPDFQKYFEDVFWQTAAENGQDITFMRYYDNEEILYFGLDPRHSSQWDMSRLPQPTKPPQRIMMLSMNDFDDLARWHILSNCADGLRKGLERAYELSVGVCVAFPPETNRQVAQCLIFESRKHFAQSICATNLDEIKEEMFRALKPYDKWDVLDLSNYRLICKIWNELNGDERLRW